MGAGGAAGGGTAGTGSAEFSPCPANDVCKILPLGDSITYGIGYNGGYRVELFRKAHADGKKITFTGSLSNGPNMVDGVMFPKNNEGHSGWKIDQLLPLIPMPALQQPPHIILLMIGTNDIAQNDNLANAPKRLGGLLDKLVMNAPDALIVVAKLTPLRSSMAVTTYNDAIPAVVQERASAGKHIILVDQFTGFPTSELGDGVHPNQQGYERMAGVWYEAIGKLLH
jgi:lysophospholipase L1-like esterase